MRTRHPRSRLLILATLLAAAGCGGTEGTPPAEEGFEPSLTSRDDSLYIKADSLWSSSVKVCWENPGGDTTARNWVRDAVENTWGAHLNTQFHGWGQCAPYDIFSNNEDIRIRISDENPHTKGVGTTLDNAGAGMVLNFTFANYRKDSCQNDRERCIRYTAVHEFGHALGFAHEQNRDDTLWGFCAEEQAGSEGTQTFGYWDRRSVMNYCNDEWDNGGRLSINDIEGAQGYYGWRGSFTQLWTAGSRVQTTLRAGQALASGMSLVSTNQKFELRFQEDGNVVLYDRTAAALDYMPIWETNTRGWSTALLSMQGDGNLVLLGPAGEVRWASNTAGHPGAETVLQDDGNLIIYSAGQAIWETHTRAVSDWADSVRFDAGFTLWRGISVRTPNERFELRLDSWTSRLQLRDLSTGAITWQTGALGTGASNAWLSPDGNFVVRDSAGNFLWQSYTGGNPGTYLVLTPNGLLSLNRPARRAIWSRSSWLISSSPERTLLAEETLHAGHAIGSPNGQYMLSMQVDGNLVLYGPSGALWASDTDGSGANRAVMQGDGNLVVYAGDQAVWSTGTHGRPRSFLAVRDDGNLVIYQYADQASMLRE